MMSKAVSTLEAFGVDFEKRVVAPTARPICCAKYAKTARERGIGRDHRPGPEAPRTCRAWWPR